MKILLSIFILLGVPAIAAVDCDLELRVHPRALIRLVELGLEQKILKVEDVLPLLETGDWFNPYRLQNSSPENLALRQSFDRHSFLASEEDRAQARSALSSKIQAHLQSAQVVNDGRKATEQIFAPVVLSQLKKNGYRHQDSTPGLGWYEQRPVFITRASIGTSDQTKAILFDPFHPSERQRAVVLDKSGGSVARSDKPYFFEKNSVPYATFLTGKQFFDLDQKANVAGSRFKFPGLDKYHIYSGHPVLVPNHSEPKIVFASRSESSDTNNQLSLLDLMKPNEGPRVLIPNVRVSSHDPRVDVLNGESFLSYYAGNAVYVYDFERGKALKRFPVAGNVRSENHALIYADQNRKFLVYAEEPRDAQKYWIRVIDLETRDVKTVQGRFDLPSQIKLIHIDGVPHLYFSAEENLILVNLRSKRSEKFPIGSPTEINHFEWDGRGFLIWVTMDGELKIFDARERHMTLSLSMFPEMSFQALPFQYLGEVYALVSVDSSWPYLVQLTKRTSY